MPDARIGQQVHDCLILKRQTLVVAWTLGADCLNVQSSTQCGRWKVAFAQWHHPRTQPTAVRRERVKGCGSERKKRKNSSNGAKMVNRVNDRISRRTTHQEFGNPQL